LEEEKQKNQNGCGNKKSMFFEIREHFQMLKKKLQKNREKGPFARFPYRKTEQSLQDLIPSSLS